MDGVRISILVATHNRRDLLRALLDSFDRQTRPPEDFEVVVVVDGSADGTLELLAERQASSPYPLRFEYQEAQGKPAAINRAAALAAAPCCLVVDDDMTADPRLVAEHLRVQESRPGGVVGVGPMGLRLPARADGLARWFKRDWEARYERLRQAERLDYKRAFGGNLSFPREAYLEVGGWRAGAGDRGGDVELGYRLERHGLPVVIARDGWTTQDFPGRFQEIAWNAWRSGRGGVAMYERHPETLAIGLGSYHETTPKARLLRELLLLARPSAGLLAAADPLIRRLPASDTIYRTILEAFRWRGAREALGADERWRSLRRGTVILAYDRPVDPALFARQMAWLRRLGHPVMSLDAYLDHRAAHRIPPARSVVVTLDVREGAAPPLAGVPATAFVDGDPPSPQDGLTVGLHGGSGEAAGGELDRRRRELEERLGQTVDHLAHPLGIDAAAGARLAADAGFRSACSNEPGINGPATPLHALRRTRIPAGLGLGRFALRLLLGQAFVVFVVLAATLGSAGAAASPPARDGRVAFAREVQVGFDEIEWASRLETVGPNGRHRRTLRTCRRLRGCSDSNPAWSPGGRRLAFDGGEASTTVSVSRPDGSRRRARVASGELDGLGQPAWSPDGRWLVVVGSRDETHTLPNGDTPLHTQASLYVIRSSLRGPLRRLTTGHFYDADPAWSASGEIAFTRYTSELEFDGGAGARIYVVRPDGTALRQLTPGEAVEPAWSPDGSRIAFNRGWYRGGSVFVMASRDGWEQRRRIARYPASEPDWSPSGKRIAFVRPTGLFTVKPNGGGTRLLARAGDDSLSAPSWRPRP